MSRRHRLFSEASARFERGVDRELPLRASAKAAVLLAELAGGTVVPGCTHASAEVPAVSVTMAADYPDRVAGMAVRPGHRDRPAAPGGSEIEADAVPDPYPAPAPGDGARRGWWCLRRPGGPT